MGKVRDSVYRRPITPDGLRSIEEKKLKWFDTEMFANFNTEILEEYLDEKNRTREGFKQSIWSWPKASVGIAIGLVFALINQYVGLKVGMVVGGSWYVAYLIGLGLKWRPTEVNVSAGASTGASKICIGFVFTYPAIYLLAYNPTYAIGMDGGHYVYLVKSIPSVSVALTASILGGMLGALYFIIFRRVWLVEDPLPMPGFEAGIKLMEIANSITTGGAEMARRSIKLVAGWAGATMCFTFFRDFPISSGKAPLDMAFGGKFYEQGDIIQPYETAFYTHFSFGLVPIQIASGWFMRFRTALLISLGSLLTWFIIVPMAVAFNVPIFSATNGHYISIQDTSVPSMTAFSGIAKFIAVGAILGGGVTGLLKMAPVFKTAMADLIKIASGNAGERRDYVTGVGWYEWPITHIPLMMGIAAIGIPVVFVAAGYPIGQSVLFGILLVALTFFLGAIAVKVMGETGTTPVSGTSFIVLILLFVVFRLTGMDPTQTVIMALIGTTVFGCAIAMAGDITSDFKTGLYIGNRPYHLMKGELTGLVPGAIVSAVGASILSYGLAMGKLPLEAPQANAFATFAQALAGGHMDYNLFLLGIIIGVFAELMTGMGTAFGLGMYFPLSITAPQLLGGAMRDYWQIKYLDRRSKVEHWSEKQKTFKLLETYMIATGLIVGEALMGTIVAITLVLPLITGAS